MIHSYIHRNCESSVVQWLKPQRAVLIKGARRTGKTELVKQIREQFEGKTEYLNAEDVDVQNMLSQRTIQNYRNLFSKTDLLIIDEAQVIPEIGLKVKLILDEVENIRVLLTGSSSISLTESSGEPLTGRKIDLELYPFSLAELKGEFSPVELRKQLEDRLVYGSYPEILKLSSADEKKTYLREIIQSYLLKDVLMLYQLRETEKINRMLQMLAHQIGQEVSYHELGKALGMSKNTVEKYLYILKDAFVVYPLGGFQKNLRKEVVKSRKWYFVDTGIRNAIISNFQGTEYRPDIGSLWENYVIMERLKHYRSQLKNTSLHFWRTYDRQEIDLIETEEQMISAYEIKWGQQHQKMKIPQAFSKAYPKAEFNVIDRNNLFEWV